MKNSLLILLLTAIAGCSILSESAEETIYYQDVVNDIDDKRATLRQHALFNFIRDDSIPPRRRLSFAPYMSYIAMTFPDMLDIWLSVPNPQSELEKRINQHVEEDNFHYNLFLHDVENVLGLSLDDFGTYSAVMRHLWGDDSRAIRQYMYSWLECMSRYRDPIITVTSLEVMEAGAQTLFGATSRLAHQSGLDDLLYLGQEHVDLEDSHSENSGNTSLGQIQITKEQREQALEITEEMFER